MGYGLEAEQQFVRAFVLPNRRDRIIHELRIPKKRNAGLEHLTHSEVLDDRYVSPVPEDLQHPEALERLLVAEGASQTLCRVIGGHHDGLETTLREALETTSADDDYIVICDPDRVALFRAEAIGEMYLLARR